MPKFLFKATYGPEGTRGVAEKGGSSRREAISELLQANGGSLEAFYFAFGETDAYVFADLPDNETATAIALTVNASGAVTVNTVPLLTPEEVDSAGQRSVDYRPPGS
jgi:uncharacterized protein with GYD domain